MSVQKKQESANILFYNCWFSWKTLLCLKTHFHCFIDNRTIFSSLGKIFPHWYESSHLSFPEGWTRKHHFLYRIPKTGVRNFRDHCKSIIPSLQAGNMIFQMPSYSSSMRHWHPAANQLQHKTSKQNKMALPVINSLHLLKRKLVSLWETATTP